MTKERKIMPMPEGDRMTMGEYEPHHPAGQEPLAPLDEAVLLLRRLCRHDLADAVAATCKPSSIAASAGEFDPTFGGASTRENLNKYDALEQFASSVRMEGEDTMSEANELVRLRDDNAMLNTLRVQLSTDSQAHLDRALAAEAELEAARENEGNAWEMVHLLRADNAALRKDAERYRYLRNPPSELVAVEAYIGGGKWAFIEGEQVDVTVDAALLAKDKP